VPNEKPDSFQCGTFEVSRNPDVRQFVEKLNRLREAVDACRVQPGVGYTVNRSSGGTVLSIKAGGAGSPVPPDPYPFQVEWFKEDDEFCFRIQEDSRLFPSGKIVSQAGETIRTGIREVTEDILILLRVKVTIDFEGSDPVQSTELLARRLSVFAGRVEPASGGAQTHASAVLATVTPQNGLVQNVRTHLSMDWTNYAGYSALIPVSTQ
jgi:hypothetical protein